MEMGGMMGLVGCVVWWCRVGCGMVWYFLWELAEGDLALE